MSELLAQLPILIAVVASILIGPFSAVAALILRRRRARQRRRSPIGIELLRSPGHSLKEQLEAVSNDVTWDIVALMVLPLLILALFFAQAQLRPPGGMLHLAPVYVFLSVAICGWIIARLVKAGSRMDALRAGYDAEVAVGQELDQLMRQGAAVFHDFVADGFNVDHVVISRRGVFAVETKGYTKPGNQRGKLGATVVFDGTSLAFPHWTTREPLEQAARQAQWLSRWMNSATGDAHSVLPVVALPGWYVERKGRGPVRVYSGRELGRLLESVGTSPLSEEVMQRVVHQVEQRCRNVAPQYKDQ
jgi:hypothetical protein